MLASLGERRHADVQRAVGWAAVPGLLECEATAEERAEVMSRLTATETYLWFVRERGWSATRCTRWLAASMEAPVVGGPVATGGR